VCGGKACSILFRGCGRWQCWGGRRCGWWTCDVNRGGNSCGDGDGGVEPVSKVVSGLPESLLVEGVGLPFNSLWAKGRGTAE
jgi:hypothetical protein